MCTLHIMKKYNYLIIAAVLTVGVGFFSIHSALAGRSSENSGGSTKHESSSTTRKFLSHDVRHPDSTYRLKTLSTFDASKAHVISRIDHIITSLESTSRQSEVRLASHARTVNTTVARDPASVTLLISKLNDLKGQITPATTSDQIEGYMTALTDLIAREQQ